MNRIFGPGGSITHLAGFKHRPQQLQLATFIEECFQNSRFGMAEAPTATGKSAAYLVAAVRHARISGLPTVISTATKNLQAQLLEKDVPLIRKVLGNFVAVRLMGKSNYECPSVCRQLGTAEANRLRKGPKWKREQLSAVNCDLKQCEETCPLRLAREAAQHSQIVVVNHALMAADVNQTVIPRGGALICDEAHHLEPLFTAALSRQVEPRLFAYLDRVTGEDRWAADHIRAVAGHVLDHLAEELAQKNDPVLYPDLPSFEVASVRLEWTWDKLEELAKTHPIYRFKNNLESLFQGSNWIRWFDPQETAFHCAPLTIARIVKARVWDRYQRAVLLSATMTQLGRFVRDDIGYPEGPDLVVPHIFDYPAQALLATPDCPRPDDPGHPIAAAEVIAGLANHLGGGTMALFTSFKSLNETRDALASRLRPDLPILTQVRDGNTEELVQKFRKGGSVLLGTNSFWEGVDFVGDQLRALIIARLPFEPPDDPLQKVRQSKIANSFNRYTIPRASLRLRQGFGRLIRTETDTGVCVILDPRVRTEAYGRKLVGSLPPCTLYTGDIAALVDVAKDWLN